MENLKCIGCGVTIQTTDQDKPGFTPKSSLEKREDHILCKRCFRLKHYNEVQDVDLTNDDFLKILNEISMKEALIVKVIDLADFTGSIIPGIARLVGQNEILVVGNKRDLLPKPINDNKIINWMKRSLKEYAIKPVDYVLASSSQGQGIDELMEYIEDYRKKRDVYVVGCTNVGKSTLINSIIKRFTEEETDYITTSFYPGTTLGVIEIPLDQDNNIVDTPGIINKHQYAHYLDKQSLTHITPTKEMKPKVYQLNDEQTLFFDGLARFDFVDGPRSSFVCYFSNRVNIHRTKLEKADQLFENHKGELLSPPTSEELERLGDYKKHDFKVPDYKCDLVISGYGWITIDEPNIKVSIHAPSGVGVFIRRSLI